MKRSPLAVMKRSTRCVLVAMFAIAAAGGCTSDGPAGDLEEFRAFATDYAAALSSQDPQRAAAFFADSVSLRMNGADALVGRGPMAAAVEVFMAALPDLRVEMDSLLVESGVIEFHWTMTGTHTGPGGTGDAVRVSGHDEWAIDDDGLIATVDQSFPVAEFARQLRQSADRPSTDDESDGWVTGSPGEAGFDSALLDQLSADIEAGRFPNTHALLIEHDGVLVYEGYFSGTDFVWGEGFAERVMGRDSLHDLRSISKSVTSALVGIALNGDFDDALSRPVVGYLPEFEADERLRAVTLHHVLTMTAGLRWNEMTTPKTLENDELRMYREPSPAFYALSRPIEEEPGSRWNYSGGLTEVLAAVVHNLTGQRIDEYVRSRLLEPLGITRFEWQGTGIWPVSRPSAAFGLRLRARDLAKIGSLYLHNGRWKGQQIVPEEWVERSLTRHVADLPRRASAGRWGYGYQWWVGSARSGERVVAGFGLGDQRLFILPDERLVVTIFAGGYSAEQAYSERILDRVLAAR